MNSLTERLLYVTLLLVFIIAGITAYVAISFGNKLNTQLKIASDLNKNQSAVIRQLQKNQEELKVTALKNTLYLECIINLHGKGLAPDEGRCRIEASPTEETEQPSVKPTVQSAQPPAPPQPPGPGNSDFGKKINNFIKKIGGSKQ